MEGTETGGEIRGNIPVNNRVENQGRYPGENE
jgi:hypothetical protein